MSCGHCGLEPHANLLCPCGITILTDRNARLLYETFYLFCEARGVEPRRKQPVPRVSFHTVSPSLTPSGLSRFWVVGHRGIEPRIIEISVTPFVRETLRPLPVFPDRQLS